MIRSPGISINNNAPTRHENGEYNLTCAKAVCQRLNLDVSQSGNATSSITTSIPDARNFLATLATLFLARSGCRWPSPFHPVLGS